MPSPLMSSLSTEEIEAIRKRCPSLSEPLSVSPALARCLADWQRSADAAQAREKRRYRNKETDDGDPSGQADTDASGRDEPGDRGTDLA
jgi:hypothetical protein